MNPIQANESDKEEITLVICDNCFEIIFEEDAEYHGELSYCHQCIEEARSITGKPDNQRTTLQFISRSHQQALQHQS